MRTIITMLGYLLCVKRSLAASGNTDIAQDVQQLLHRVQIVEDKGRQYEETITTMKSQIEQLEEKVAALETSNVEKQTMIDDLQYKLNDVLDVIDDETKEHGTHDETEVNTYEQESEPRNNNNHTDDSTVATNNNRQHIVKTTASINSKARLQQIKKGQRQTRLAVTSEHVAFHVSASTTQQSLHSGEHVILDTVLLNVGNGYLVDHGLFIAPVSGIYVFSVSVMNIYDDRIQFDIMKNGNSLGRILADGHTGGHDQGSMTMPVQLQEGDQFWLAIQYPETNANFYGGYFTSFSGFLLSLN